VSVAAAATAVGLKRLHKHFGAVRADLPQADEAALKRLSGVRAVDIRGDRVIVQTTDSDAVVRYILTNTPARDREIIAHNLEDAFLALTGDDAGSADPLRSSPDGSSG
jgi:ABC-2 type transport system ATP-binding protein